MDLETAAHSLLLQVRQLRAAFGEVTTASERCVTRLTAARQQVEDTAASLREDHDAFLAALEDAGKDLVQDAAPVEPALVETGAACGDAFVNGTRLLETEQQAQEALALELLADQRQVIVQADAAEAASRSAVDRAAEVAQQIIQDGSDLRQAYAGLEGEMEQRLAQTAKWDDALDAQVVTALETLETSAASWPPRVAEVVEMSEEAFEALREHLAQVANYSVEKASQLVEAQMDLLQAGAATLGEELTALADVVDQQTGALEESLRTLVEKHDATAQLSAGVEDLADVTRRRWAELGF